jgi:capsular exopolysaccharide synthesis family protein
VSRGNPPFVDRGKTPATRATVERAVSEPNRTGLADYLRVIQHQWVLIAAVTLLFGGIALILSLRADPSYQAEATLRFQEPSEVIDEAGGGVAPRETTQERAALGAEAVTSPPVFAAVGRELGGPLGASVSATTDPNANLVLVQASGSEPRRVARVANAFARNTREVLRRRFRRSVDTQLRAIRPDVERIQRLGEPTVVAKQLELLARLRALRRLGEPVELLRPAVVPAQPTTPRKLRNTLLGLLAGLTFGLVAAFVRDSLDRRLRGTQEMSEAASLPVIGRLREEALGKLPLPGSGAAGVDFEAIRILRANLEFLDVDRRPAKVLVTSPLPEEGKSTVAAALAVAAGLAGQRVLLLECDLRRPVIAQRLGLRRAPGLTDYLAGQAAAADVIQTLSVGGGISRNGDEASSIAFIAAGSEAPRPTELLASDTFTEFIAVVGRSYDCVVLDSSPLLPVADTLELVACVDRVVMCARARHTTRDELRAAGEALDRLPSPPAGLIVTGLRRGDELDYDYYARRSADEAPTVASTR